MKNKSLQLFSDEYLENCKEMTPTQVAQFLEDFRLAKGKFSSKSKQISLKIPENFLEAFKKECELSGIKYQTNIKKLMREWLYSK